MLDPFVLQLLDKMWLLFKEEFEDTKEVIIIRIYIEEEQTTQWPKEKKDKQRSIKHTHKRADKIYVLHIYISFNPRTTHQTSQSQAMQV